MRVVHHRRRHVVKTIVLARHHYRVRSGHTATIALRLTRSGSMLLAGARHHRLRVRARATLGSGRGAVRLVLLQSLDGG